MGEGELAHEGMSEGALIAHFGVFFFFGGDAASVSPTDVGVEELLVAFADGTAIEPFLDRKIAELDEDAFAPYA